MACTCRPPVKEAIGGRDDLSSIGILSESLAEERADAAATPERRPASPTFVMQEPCSDFCKNIDPLRQKEIIQGMLSLDTAERSPTSVNNKRFLISAAWWRRWKDYVDFDVDVSDRQPSPLYEKPLATNRDTTYEQLIINLKNSNPGVAPTSRSRSKTHRRPQLSYDYPGRITNL